MSYTAQQFAAEMVHDGAWTLVASRPSPGTRALDYSAAVYDALLAGDSAPPVVEVDIADITVSGGSTVVGTITLYDSLGIDISRLVDGDGESDTLAIYDPRGTMVDTGAHFALGATTSATADTTWLRDVITLYAPSGGWASGHNGQWSVRVVASAGTASITDIGTSPATVPPGEIVGKFTVNIEPSMASIAAVTARRLKTQLMAWR